MDPWLPGIPRHVNTHILQPAKPLDASAVVLHRTYGYWVGDMQTLLKGRVPSVHFLVGKNGPNWCQMVPVNVMANHAAGANGWSVGIELSGRNEEPLTEWQVTCVAIIAQWLNRSLGIPFAFYDGKERIRNFDGWLSHANVQTEPKYRHSDMVTRADWNRIYTLIDTSVVDQPVTPPPTPIPATIPTTEIAFMETRIFTETLPQLLSDDNGNGWTSLPWSLDQIVSVAVNGPYPPADGYYPPVSAPTLQRRGANTIVTWHTSLPKQPVTLLVKRLPQDV